MSARRGAAILAPLVLVGAALGAAPITLARFTDSVARNASFGTATLAAPTNLAGTGGPTTASLTWTASGSNGASGYQVLRSATSGSGYSQVGTVTPLSATSTNDTPGAGTWYYVLRTYFSNWTSPASNQATVTVNPPATTTGPKGCAAGSDAAETVNAGHNDGFEFMSISACDDDGIFALDKNTGTSTANSCTANTKDKHRFWGYSFGLPATISSISGITVTPTVGQSNNGGTTLMCIQLSWDGGASWTAVKSVTLTANGLTTYTIGGASDTWGRAWTRSEFASGTFRVRVINNSTQGNKDIRLDALDVAVSYIP